MVIASWVLASRYWCWWKCRGPIGSVIVTGKDRCGTVTLSAAVVANGIDRSGALPSQPSHRRPCASPSASALLSRSLARSPTNSSNTTRSLTRPPYHSLPTVPLLPPPVDHLLRYALHSPASYHYLLLHSTYYYDSLLILPPTTCHMHIYYILYTYIVLLLQHHKTLAADGFLHIPVS